jgi:drug/metabolite transporter (DMT)-like permease
VNPLSGNIQGILWALVAAALFSVVAAMAKIAVVDYHVLQILFIRQLIIFISVLPNIIHTFPHSFKTKHPMIHAARITGAFVALSSGIWAVAVLPLTTAITLAFCQVFFVALLALKFLGEPVGIHRFSAIIAGFTGVIILMRPGLDGIFDFNAFIPIGGALGAAIAVTSVRKLSKTESTATLLSYQAIFVGLAAGIPMIWLWVTPSLPDILFLVSMGVLATIAQWIGVRALRLAELSVVGPVEYVKLIYAAILGYLLFAEIPDTYAILGAAVIIGSSVYIFHREMLQARK